MTFDIPIADKIRRILNEPGWTEEAVAVGVGVSRSTVVRWLNGSEPGEVNRGKIDALYVRVWSDSEANQVPLVGYVGAGQEISDILIGGENLVKGPPHPRSNTVAVRVTGDWMLPSFDDGWLLYYSQQLHPEELVHHRCFVKVAGERTYVKTVRRGSQAGLWTLTDYNSRDITDVQVEWVSPIDWIRPDRPDQVLLAS